jgi:hypothetical protein
MASKRKSFAWKVVGRMMPDKPDIDGEIFLMAEVDVPNGFPGYPNAGHPTVSFIAGTKPEKWIDPLWIPDLKPPIYRYTVDVDFAKGKESGRAGTSFRVVRSWDAKGTTVVKNTRTDNKYVPAPEAAHRLANDLSDGVWKAIILGEVKDQVGVHDETWRNIAPLLVLMAEQAPEMRKMEELYLGPVVAHGDLHTAAGEYEESIMIKEETGSFEKFIPQLERLVRGLRMDLSEPNPGEIWLDLNDDYTSDNLAIYIFENGVISFHASHMELAFSLPEKVASLGPEDDSDDVRQTKKLDFNRCYNFRFITQTFPALAGYPVIEKILVLMKDYYGGGPEHGDLHTAQGEYEEGLSALIKKEEKLLTEVSYPFLSMPAPTKISKEKNPPAHGDLHTAAGEYEE